MLFLLCSNSLSNSLSWSGGIPWTCQSSSSLWRKVFSRFLAGLRLHYVFITSSLRVMFPQEEQILALLLAFFFFTESHSPVALYCDLLSFVSLIGYIFTVVLIRWVCISYKFNGGLFSCVNLTIHEIKSKFAVRVSNCANSLNLTEDQGGL